MTEARPLKKRSADITAAIHNLHPSKGQQLQKNAEFHFLIYRTANLPTLFSIIDSLWLQAGPTLSLLAPGYQKSRQGSRNHLNAIESIRQGSGKLLRKAIEKDLKDGTNYIMPLLDDI